MVSKITNKILPTIEEWQNRPLEKVYPFVFLDAIHYHVRENNIVVKKSSIYSTRIQYRRIQRNTWNVGRRK